VFCVFHHQSLRLGNKPLQDYGFGGRDGTFAVFVEQMIKMTLFGCGNSRSIGGCGVVMDHLLWIGCLTNTL
jgi:hypothetical protein